MDIICQSCGMPILEEKLLGTNFDGSKNKEFCIYCFEDGKFTMDLPLKEYIDEMIKRMVKDNFSEKEAKKLANKVLPNLKRWKK